MFADGVDFSAVEDDDHVGVLNGRDALGDDDFGGIGQFFAERLADECVRLGIDGGSGVVENEDLGFFQEGARDAEPLFLSARNVCAALFDEGVVFFGKALDKFVRLREFAGVDDLLVGGVLVAPAQAGYEGVRKARFLRQTGKAARKEGSTGQKRGEGKKFAV